MTTWPASLPQKPQSQGFRETVPEVIVRTDMDAGPAKVRRRFTAAVRNLQMTMEMSNAQIATFDTFFNDTIKGGALNFDFPDPRTGTTVDVRIVNTPQYRNIGGEYWGVELEIEVLP